MSYLKKNLGITLVALIVTIVVIAIIASTMVYLGTNIIKKASLQTTNTDMMLIQAKAQTIYEKLSFEKTGEELETSLPGTKVLDGSNDASNLIKAGIQSENITKYFVWNENTLKETGLEGVNPRQGELFYVNYEGEVEVITSIGFKHTDGNTYYKLSDIKNLSF